MSIPHAFCSLRNNRTSSVSVDFEPRESRKKMRDTSGDSHDEHQLGCALAMDGVQGCFSGGVCVGRVQPPPPPPGGDELLKGALVGWIGHTWAAKLSTEVLA